MNLRPGSVLWLLRHELRLFYFGLGGAARKGPPRAGLDWRLLGAIGLVWGGTHVLAWAMLAAAPFAPQGVLALAAATFLLVSVFAFMLSSALKASVDALFARGDIDLLLSSPLSSKPIFVARLAGIVLGMCALHLFFVAPFAHVGAALGQIGWLALYPAVLGLAAIATSAAIALTLVLAHTIGPRKTRIVAQVLSALAGGAIVLVTQAYNVAGETTRAAAQAWLMQSDPSSLLWLPARAALGQPVPLALFCGVAALSLAASVTLLHRGFVRGILQAKGSAPANAPPKAGPARFRSGLLWLTVNKEWKLIRRDPHLISQVLLQLIYLLPAFVLVLSNKTTLLPMVAAAITLLACSLAAALAWITVYAEDAPDLLLSSPAHAGTLRTAKMLAAAAPALVLPALPLAWIVWHELGAGILLVMPLLGAVTCSVHIVHWVRRPGRRDSFTNRGARDLKGNLIELFSSLCWAAVAFLVMYTANPANSPVQGTTVAATLASPAAALLCAWWLRRRAT